MQSQVLYLQSQPTDTCSSLYIGHSFFCSPEFQQSESLKIWLLSPPIGKTSHRLCPRMNSLFVSQIVNAKYLLARRNPVEYKYSCQSPYISFLFVCFKGKPDYYSYPSSKRDFLSFSPSLFFISDVYIPVLPFITLLRESISVTVKMNNRTGPSSPFLDNDVA